MLRFPNPGSTIDNFVEVYKSAFNELNGQVVSLDTIVEAIVNANLATSSGHMGSEAIARSTRVDRSRDPLYNQLKMYAELFRALGWLHPTEQSALNYTFTLLGRQIVAANDHYLALLGETVLGICYPSHVLSIKGEYDLRPFAFILRTMLECDNALSRDEMIIGPLSASSDRNTKSVSNMSSLVKRVRESSEAITSALNQVSEERGIQINTLRNYTRWPIAIMRDCGWTEKVRLRFRDGGGSFEAHQLTTKGILIADHVASSADIRIDELDVLPFDEKSAISIHAHYKMLERAGFNLSSVHQKLEQQRPALNRALDLLDIEHTSPLLFSPFQSLSIAETQKIFPGIEESAIAGERRKVNDADGVVGRGSRDHLFVEPAFVKQTVKSKGKGTGPLEEEFRVLREQHESSKAAAIEFVNSRTRDTQNEFYPLVSSIFQILGFKSDYSRAGVNYQRWDACVWLNSVALPIEIKSPTEEVYLSTKAIRQALENKIILLARGGLKTSREVTSLIVGYKLPNERGDMSSLIDDIYSAFGISIGVIDLATLAILGIRSVTESVTIDDAQLGELRGFLHV